MSRILTRLKAIVQQPVAQTPRQDMPQQMLACIRCAKSGSKATVTKHFRAIANGKKIGFVIFPIGALVLYALVVSLGESSSFRPDLSHIFAGLEADRLDSESTRRSNRDDVRRVLNELVPALACLNSSSPGTVSILVV